MNLIEYMWQNLPSTNEPYQYDLDDEIDAYFYNSKNNPLQSTSEYLKEYGTRKDEEYDKK